MLRLKSYLMSGTADLKVCSRLSFSSQQRLCRLDAKKGLGCRG